MIEEILSLDPITSITLMELLVLYIVYFTTALLVAMPISLLLPEEEREEEYNVMSFLVEVPIEDGIFRAIPLLIAGSPGLIFVHPLWALAHRRVPTIIFAGLFGILILRLWLGGLWLVALGLHIAHDIFFYKIHEAWKKRDEE